MKRIREEIREQSALGVFHALYVTDQTERRAVSDTSDHGIQPDPLKFFHKRFCSDPVIPQKHHSFFSVLVRDIHHLFYDLCHFPALKRLKIPVFFRRDPILVVVISLIDDILRTEPVTNLFFKLFQDIRTYRCRVAIPVHIFFAGKLIKHQCKLVEKGRKAQYIDVWVGLNEFAQTLHGERVCLWLADIKGHLMFHVFPVVDHRIVHMHRIPEDIREKAHRIIVERHGLYRHVPACFVILPRIRVYDFTCRPVHDLPPALDVIPAVWREHIGIEPFHQMDLKLFLLRRVDRRHQIHLLDLIRILLRPGIVFSGGVVGRVYL